MACNAFVQQNNYLGAVHGKPKPASAAGGSALILWDLTTSLRTCSTVSARLDVLRLCAGPDVKRPDFVFATQHCLRCCVIHSFVWLLRRAPIPRHSLPQLVCACCMFYLVPTVTCAHEAA
eukprot:gene15003-biopygen21681